MIFHVYDTTFEIAHKTGSVNMVKKYFILLLSFGIVNHISAQQYENEPLPSASEPAQSSHHYNSGKIDINRLRFGAYFAPNISWLHPTSSKSDDGHYTVSSDGGKFGYSWGLMADYYFAENYGISTGFNLNTSGGKIISNATSKVDTTKASTVKSSNFDYTLQYLEIPLALKLRSDAINNNGLRIFGQIGLTLGINISRKVDYTVEYNDASANAQVATGSNEKLKGTLAVPPVMLQMNLGMGIEYPIKEKLSFYFGMFFNNGFLPDAISPENYSMGYNGSFSGTNTRLNSFAFRFGLFF